jgi:hypothetical protein
MRAQILGKEQFTISKNAPAVLYQDGTWEGATYVLSSMEFRKERPTYCRASIY